MKSWLRKIYYRYLFNFTSPKKRFTRIYQDNYWASEESISGPGSSMDQTESIRRTLPLITKQYAITSILDIPCGDFHWMQTIPLPKIEYIGADIVEKIIENNIRQFSTESRKFISLDLTKDPLPYADAIFVRDCFIHLSNNLISRAIENIKASKSKYLITNTFKDVSTNTNIKTGTWRRVNLQISPFNLPSPLEEWEETEHFSELDGRKFTVIYEISSL